MPSLSVSDTLKGGVTSLRLVDRCARWTRVFVNQREVSLADLMPKSTEWLQALATVIAKTEEGGASRREDT